MNWGAKLKKEMDPGPEGVMRACWFLVGNGGMDPRETLNPRV